jgi:hypothetical protein
MSVAFDYLQTLGGRKMLRIVSVAKVAAYVLMTAALVAFVACELDPGEKGEQGTKGTQGTAGERGLRGAKGEPGTAPAAPDASTPYVGELYARGGMADHLVLVNDGVGVVGDPSDLDLADRFRGGTPPVTYSNTAPNADGPFTIKLNEATGMLTVTVDEDYAFTTPVALTGTTMETKFTVTAKDADGATDEKVVSIKRNAPPFRTAEDPDAVIVTTQAVTPAEDAEDDPPAGCPKRNVCTRTVLVGVDNAAGALYEDELPESVLLAVDDGGGANVGVVLAGHKLTFTGLKSTWDGDIQVPAHVPKTIKVSATDAMGLEAVAAGTDDAFVTFMVTVDAPPTIQAPFPSGVSLNKGNTAVPAVGAPLSEFFNDPDNGTAALTYTAKSDTPTIVTVVETQGANLMVTPLDAGSATITVTATDTNEQSVSQTVTIRVTAATS